VPEPAQKPGKSGQVFRTPDNLLDAVRTYLGVEGFAFDFAANAENSVASQFWGEQENSLAQPADSWATYAAPGWGWLNPPFGRMDTSPGIGAWARLCLETAALGGQVAFLVPAAVGANWWRDYVHGQAHVLFLNGRIHFMPDRPTWGYPKDCALCLYSAAEPYAPTYKVWTWKDRR
jgi:phage N-6-adenine-methyltransferase